MPSRIQDRPPSSAIARPSASNLARVGSIDWLGLPRFEQRVLRAPLGEAKHGRWLGSRPRRVTSGSRARYTWATRHLETVFRTEHGAGSLTDSCLDGTARPIG